MNIEQQLQVLTHKPMHAGLHKLFTVFFFSSLQNWGELPSNSGQVQEFLESLNSFVGILGGARTSMKER